MSTQTLIAHAAEAKILHEKDFVIKDRISKGYRHPLLDKKIIRQRTKKEAKILEKAHKLIGSPLPLNLEETQESKTNKIKMPFINGKRLSENLEKLNYKEICKIIGNNITKLHDNDLIHGDLTTSNMIYVDGSESETKALLQKNKSAILKGNSKENLQLNNIRKTMGHHTLKGVVCKAPCFLDAQKLKAVNYDPIINKGVLISDIIKAKSQAQADFLQQSEPAGEPKVIFIDFGLSFISTRIEDKAVDLHLIKQALEAKHFSIYKECEKIILENYNSKDRTKVLEQLKKVEARGRYRKNVH